jgi:hypothetical protein
LGWRQFVPPKTSINFYQTTRRHIRQDNSSCGKRFMACLPSTEKQRTRVCGV